MDEIVNEFLIESYEMLDDIDQGLIALEENPSDVAVLERIFRALHTIKGTCGFLSFTNLEKVAHAGENLLSMLRDGTLAIDAEVADALLATVDSIRAHLAVIEATESDEGEESAELIATLRELAGRLPTSNEHEPDDSTKAETSDEHDAVEGETPADGDAAADDVTPVGDDKLVGTIMVEQGLVDGDDVAIAAVEQSMGDRRKIGEILVDQGKADQMAVAEALRQQESMRDRSGLSAADSTIRVDVSLLDELMNLVGELVLTRNEIMQVVDESRDTTFTGPSQRLNIITSELQEGVMKTRMQPIGNVWGKLPRLVRDLSHQMGKQVRIEMDGKDTELDKTIIEATKDPLTHIVRNTIDHGIESPEERKALGKEPEGVLHLRASHEGGQVNIEITDDGAGIDIEVIKAKAVERGLVSAEAASRMSDAEATHLIFLPGFSTASVVTNVSGRGVGMDVVKTNIEKIGGSVEVRTAKNEGTTFKIKIPLTLAIIPALSVLCGGNRYAIPQINLIELVRVERGHGSNGIEYVHGAPVYRLRGRLLPIVDLREVLDTPGEVDDVVNVVVLQADDRQFGVIVDEINETQEIVVKPLGHVVQEIPLYSGATILGDGRVALILDVLGLAQHANIITAHGEPNPFAELTDGMDAATSVEAETLLLLEVGDDRRVAVPLSAVARLEEFAADAVERSGHRPVVQYRGEIMSLIDLGQCLGYGSWIGTDDAVSVVVYQHLGRDVGLIVGQILDIVEHDCPAGADSVVISGRVTDLFDVAALVDRELPASEADLIGAL